MFDPLGFVSPFIVKVKILFQELCADKSSWDDELPSEMKQRWSALINELEVLQNVRVPRCYFSFPSAKRRIELHGFSDTSQKAYAAAIYIRRVVNDHVETTLICSKSRVSLLKLQTIPGLELLGALILARLMNTVLNALSNIITIRGTTVQQLIESELWWRGPEFLKHD